MTHVRTQIRHLVRDTLTSELPSDYVIETSRKSKRNADHSTAHVNIKCLNDQVREDEVQFQGNDASDIHVASLYIRVQRTGTGDSLDDQLDADEVRINHELMQIDWSSLLEEPPRLMQSNFSDDGDGEKDLAEIVIRYDCEYRVSRTDLETVIS